MTLTSTDMIREAVNEGRPFSLSTLGERVFAAMFKGLVYPQIWEDPVCDMAALGLTASDDIVCIASGGCNMMSYLTASPASVTAVDLSPWHVELGRLKLAAARHLPDHAAFYRLFGDANRASNPRLIEDHLFPHLPPEARAFWTGRRLLRRRSSVFARGLYRFGALGAFIGTVHLVCRAAGVDFQRLLSAQILTEQTQFFEQKIRPLIRSRLVRFIARRPAALFGLGIPPTQFDKLAADADGDILPVLEERTRKLFCDFPISETYFAWQAASRGYRADGTRPLPPYLQAAHFETIRTAAPRAEVAHRSITDLLAEAPAGSKSVYILLDAQDWMSDAQLTALWQQITRTARPGARVLFRTGGAPDILPGRVPDTLLGRWDYDTAASARAFSTDRSAIYGGVHLYRFGG